MDNNGICGFIPDENLRKQQLLELCIAKEIKRICEKNDIPYFLIGGSCLGAVRHGGFIPWDDDMDIGMLRTDFKAFMEACKTDLGEDFFLQTWDTDPEYPFSYAKIRLKGTHIQEEFSVGTKMDDGIFVDILPFDSVPESGAGKKIQALIYYTCKRLLWLKKGLGKNIPGQSTKQAIKYYVFKLLSFLVPYRWIKNFYGKAQQKYNHLQTQYIVPDGAYAFRKETICRTWEENLKEIAFEDEMFLTFSEWDAYLTHIYGDYMQLPPPEKRGGHSVLKIDFGRYE